MALRPMSSSDPNHPGRIWPRRRRNGTGVTETHARQQTDTPVMTKAVFKATRSAPSQHDNIRVLLRAGRNDEAIVQLCSVVVTQPNDLVAKELLFDAFFQKR